MVRSVILILQLIWLSPAWSGDGDPLPVDATDCEIALYDLRFEGEAHRSLENPEALKPAEIRRDYSDPSGHDAFRTSFSEARNSEYLRLATGAATEGRDHTLFFFVENILLKDLNETVMRDKDLVTTVENYYQVLFAEELAKVRVRVAGSLVPVAEVIQASYYDWKSVRFAIDLSRPGLARDAVVAALEEVHENVGRRFRWEGVGAREFVTMYAHGINARERGFVLVPEGWHLAGVGSTEDQAARAARHARGEFERSEFFQDFDRIESELSDRARYTESLRSSLQDFVTRDTAGAIAERQPQAHWRAMFVSGEGHTLVPSKELIEVFRKIRPRAGQSYEEAVAERVLTVFGVDISNVEVSVSEWWQKEKDEGVSEQVILNKRSTPGLKVSFARVMQAYLQYLDEFQVPIRSASRNQHAFSEDDAHVLSIDYTGQGARNLFSTAVELAGVVTAREAVVAAREAERKATEEMRELDRIVHEAALESFDTSLFNETRGIRTRLVMMRRRASRRGADLPEVPQGTISLKYVQDLVYAARTGGASAIGIPEAAHRVADGDFIIRTGDDAIIRFDQPISQEQWEEFLRRLGASGRAADFRVTLLSGQQYDLGTPIEGAVVPSDQRAELIALAEGMEKRIRGELLRQLSLEEYRRFLVAVQLYPCRMDGPDPDCISGVRVLVTGSDLDPQLRDRIRGIIRTVVASIRFPDGKRVRFISEAHGIQFP